MANTVAAVSSTIALLLIVGVRNSDDLFGRGLVELEQHQDGDSWFSHVKAQGGGTGLTSAELEKVEVPPHVVAENSILLQRDQVFCLGG